MKKQLLSTTIPLAIIITVGTAWLVRAGNLTPPAGPITGTMKDLATVEPRTALSGPAPITISQRGSYYLTGNVVATNNTMDGIVITASEGVSLDLRGYSVVGMGGNGVGVRVSAASEIAIFNGAVVHWGGDGIKCDNTTNCSFKDLRIRDNGQVTVQGVGLNVGDYSTVVNCVSSHNGTYGIQVGAGCVVSDSTAAFNGSDGIHVGAQSAGSLIRGCATYRNTGFGITLQSGSSAVENVNNQNAAGNILQLGSGNCTFSNC